MDCRAPGFPVLFSLFAFMNVHFSGPTGVPVKSTFQVQSTKQSSLFPEEGVGHGLIT